MKSKSEYFYRFLFFAVLILVTNGEIFSNSMEGNSPEQTYLSSAPFLLSLFLSHGSGLYKIGQPQKAKPYLLAHIFAVDIPLLALVGGIFANAISPEIFHGDTLRITEYVVNTLFISVLVAVPVIRFFECREVRRESEN